MVANFNDHRFLLSMSAKTAPSQEALREAFNPQGWRADLERTLETTDALGRRFRAVAEVGQLLPRRTVRGNVPARA